MPSLQAAKRTILLQPLGARTRDSRSRAPRHGPDRPTTRSTGQAHAPVASVSHCPTWLRVLCPHNHAKHPPASSARTCTQAQPQDARPGRQPAACTRHGWTRGRGAGSPPPTLTTTLPPRKAKTETPAGRGREETRAPAAASSSAAHGDRPRRPPAPRLSSAQERDARGVPGTQTRKSPRHRSPRDAGRLARWDKGHTWAPRRSRTPARLRTSSSPAGRRAPRKRDRNSAPAGAVSAWRARCAGGPADGGRAAARPSTCAPSGPRPAAGAPGRAREETRPAPSEGRSCTAAGLARPGPSRQRRSTARKLAEHTESPVLRRQAGPSSGRGPRASAPPAPSLPPNARSGHGAAGRRGAAGHCPRADTQEAQPGGPGQAERGGDPAPAHVRGRGPCPRPPF